MKLEEQNQMMYFQGIYFRDALLCTVGNMFNNGKPLKYPDKPYEFFEEQKELTEEEKKKRTEMLFKSLEVSKVNDNLRKRIEKFNASR